MAHPETVLESNDIETVARVGDSLGYARVSTHDQNPDAQRDRLIEAGAIRVFTDIVSGQRFDRPALAELIDHARPGDRLCIIRLDRLGRSLREASHRSPIPCGPPARNRLEKPAPPH